MSRYDRDARDSRDRGSGSIDCKVYVGDLPRDAQEKDIERAFSYYGPLKNVWVARNPPGFAFVEYDDPRDAEDSVRGLDGSTICGTRVRVELSTGKVRPKPWMRRGPPRQRRAFDPSDRCFECGDRGHYAYDCTRYRGGGGGGGGSGSRRRRSYSRSRSRSPDRSRRNRSYSRSRSRSRSRGRYRTRSRSASRSISPVRRSRSPSRNGAN